MSIYEKNAKLRASATRAVRKLDQAIATYPRYANRQRQELRTLREKLARQYNL